MLAVLPIALCIPAGQVLANPHNVGTRDTGKIATFKKTGGTRLRERKYMKMWRLERKQRGKWRPNSLDPSLGFYFILPLCLWFLSGFPWHVLVQTRDEHGQNSGSATNLCSGLKTHQNSHRWPDSIRCWSGPPQGSHRKSRGCAPRTGPQGR